MAGLGKLVKQAEKMKRGIEALQAQLDAKKVQLDVDEDARLWLAEHGYDPKMGARPMQRLIQEKIKRELAEEVLFGNLSRNGGTVHVTVKDGELHVSCEARESATVELSAES